MGGIEMENDESDENGFFRGHRSQQEIRLGDIYDSESPQNSNEPTHPATVVTST